MLGLGTSEAEADAAAMTTAVVMPINDADEKIDFMVVSPLQCAGQQFYSKELDARTDFRSFR